MVNWKAYKFVQIVALSMGLALARGATAQRTPTGTISGYIVGPDGRAVPGARVVVEPKTRIHWRNRGISGLLVAHQEPQENDRWN